MNKQRTAGRNKCDFTKPQKFSMIRKAEESLWLHSTWDGRLSMT